MSSIVLIGTSYTNIKTLCGDAFSRKQNEHWTSLWKCLLIIAIIIVKAIGFSFSDFLFCFVLFCFVFFFQIQDGVSSFVVSAAESFAEVAGQNASLDVAGDVSENTIRSLQTGARTSDYTQKGLQSNQRIIFLVTAVTKSRDKDENLLKSFHKLAIIFVYCP